MPVQAEPQWQGIESAPRDGEGILLTDGKWVHYGWWRVDGYRGPHPWAMIDSHDMTPNGCCDREEPEWILPNGWNETGPTHWMPLPTPPAGGSDAE